MQAYARAARKRGAKVIEHNRVLELHQRPDGWDVVTEQGTIRAEHVVIAAGLWAKQVGRMAGLDLPVAPLEHHYLLTETVPEVAALEETPTLKRSNAHPIIADECRAVREAAGLLDISGVSRFEVTGPDAHACLDGVLTCRLRKPGRARLAPMLSPEGG